MSSREKLLVSVITSTYNSEKTLAKTIESVLNQTYENIEYIISDGLSTDNTIGIAESYRKLFEERGYEFKILSSKDDGIYSGINKGIREAHGIIVGNVNSDDYYEPEMVQVAVEEYISRPYHLFYADLNIVRPDGKLVKIKQAKRMKNYVTTRYWNHPTMFVPKKLYQKRLYNEYYKYYADCDYMLWIYKHSSKIAVVNKPLSNFRLGGVSTQTDIRESLAKVKERYRGYRQNGYSRLYYIECLAMDLGKDIVMRIIK